MTKFSGLALEVEKPGRMSVVHPVTRQVLRDANGGEAYIEIVSVDSEAARKHARTVQRRRLAMRGRAKLTPEEMEAEHVELLTALTVGWHLLSLEGEDLKIECTPENARELYGDPAVAWLREQVDEYAADRSNFSKASSNNSSSGRK